MKKLALLLAVVSILLVALSVGVSAADAYPNGCADCHKKEGDKDYSLSAELAKLPKHPKLPNATLASCLKCHKAGSKLALNTKMHDDHNSSKTFTGNLKGTCLSCHVAGADGKPTKDLKGLK